ncbi:MAG: nucleic acid-binding protein [Anaerolineae bacterium]|nr:nucleic acid-binding protein [Anaerolineae bacterium]
MTKTVVLDSGPLGKLAHPRPSQEILGWLNRLITSGVSVAIPEIIDYEVRRNFLLEGLTQSIVRLDELKEELLYLPLNTEAMLLAAQLWADARKRGRPTAAPDALDGDVILAAQAQQVGAVVATENVGHLALFVEAKHWMEIE